MTQMSENELGDFFKLYSGRFSDNTVPTQNISIIRGKAQQILKECVSGFSYSISKDRGYIADAAKAYRFTNSPSENDLKMINSKPDNDNQLDNLLMERLNNAFVFGDLASLFTTARFMNDIGLSNTPPK